MKVADVIACSFDQWYDNFKGLTARSIILGVPTEFTDYLLEDYIVLPKNTPAVQPSIAESESDDEGDWCGDDSDEVLERPEFAALEVRLQSAIAALGGAVFSKMNWSSPKDASWMLCGNSLKCTTPSDIFLLMKASDFIAHDLTAPFALCSDVSTKNLHMFPEGFRKVIVLRQWQDYRPDGEFRCFVKDGVLIGICQRNHDAFFDSIIQSKCSIKADLTRFFKSYVRERFPLFHYTFDVYWHPPRSDRPARTKLIDFNVFGKPTDALMFDWVELEELLTTDIQEPMFRYQTDRTVRPNIMSQYKMPVDFIDVASGNHPEKLIDFVQTQMEAQSKT